MPSILHICNYFVIAMYVHDERSFYLEILFMMTLRTGMAFERQTARRRARIIYSGNQCALYGASNQQIFSMNLVIFKIILK